MSVKKNTIYILNFNIHGHFESWNITASQSITPGWDNIYSTATVKYCDNTYGCNDMKPVTQYEETLQSLYTGIQYKLT